MVQRKWPAGLEDQQYLEELARENNLAEDLQDRGDYHGAEGWHRKILESKKEILGLRHPSTLVTMNNLAVALERQGKHEEAESLHGITLMDRRYCLGPLNPHTLDSINNLAVLYEKQGRYSAAEQQNREALSLRKQEFGASHPGTLASMNNLAVVLEKKGKFDEAEQIHRQAIALKVEVLGSEHPDTLVNWNNLAVVLEKQTKYAEAEDIHLRTLNSKERVLGREHPSTLISLGNLEVVLSKQGKLDERQQVHSQRMKQANVALLKHFDDSGYDTQAPDELRRTTLGFGKQQTQLRSDQIIVAAEQQSPASAEDSSDTSKSNTAAMIRIEGTMHADKEAPVASLENAVSSRNIQKVVDLLEDSLASVAIGEYSWISEVRELGYSPLVIAMLLLDKHAHAPWIFSVFGAALGPPDRATSSPTKSDLGSEAEPPNFHVARNEGEWTVRDANGGEVSVSDAIQYLCGIGGIRTASDGSAALDYGTAEFEHSNSMATLSLEGPRDRQTLVTILGNLEYAISIMRDVGACSDSFTVLATQGLTVELHRLEIWSIGKLKECVMWPRDDTRVILDNIFECFGDIEEAWRGRRIADLCALATQFLALALLSYFQAHCGSIRPFFLDTELSCIILTGWQSPVGEDSQACRIMGSLVNLSCFGDMLEQPAFVFRRLSGHGKSAVGIPQQGRLDLVALPEDLLDTWGPGELVMNETDDSRVHIVRLGGGNITAHTNEDSHRLHWERGPRLVETPHTTFDRFSKATIGAMVVKNERCKADSLALIRQAAPMFEELGTSPSYWDLAERELGLGLQGGQSLITTLQFNQTWAKIPGRTKKHVILSGSGMVIHDLESYFGVEVSLCTGVARRVQLRELLAELLPIFVGEMVRKPRLWESLAGRFAIVDILRTVNRDLRQWLAALDVEHRTAFETLAMALLSRLQDTGVDRGGSFVIACLAESHGIHCFKVPCVNENSWARLLADSPDTATFAYTTSNCLESRSVQCRGTAASWANSTKLLWTAVSCCREDGQALTPPPTPQQAAKAASAMAVQPASSLWKLRHHEKYLIGQSDAPLTVQVDRPSEQDEPRLLVIESKIKPEILRRLYRIAQPRRRLKERKVFDQTAEPVTVLVSEV